MKQGQAIAQGGVLQCFGLTDTGKRRDRNEDQFLIGGLNKSMMVQQTSLEIDDPTRLFGGTHGHLFVVADGMGGHRSGDVASSTVVDALTHYVLNTMPWFFRLQSDYAEEQLEVLKSGLQSCQEQLQRVRGPEQDGMGTTLTLAYVLWPRLYVVHAGDSRCYLLRDGKLEQVTTDHTFAQTLMEEGKLSEKEAETSRWSHVLWNALGGSEDKVIPDAYRAHLELGDTVLLCTDGLTGQVADEEIAGTLQEEDSAEASCKRLVSAANAAGGRDNVTVVVARFLGYTRPQGTLGTPRASTQAR